LFTGKDPPEKLFRIKLVVGVLISLLEHAEDFINYEEVVAVRVQEVEEAVVPDYLLGLLISHDLNDLRLDSLAKAGFPADERQLFETLNVVPVALVVESGTVFISAVIARLFLLLVPSEVVGAGVVHPLPLTLLPNLMHADPVGFCVSDQSSDELVLDIVMDGDEVTAPFHADELSGPPIIRLRLNVDKVFVLFALLLQGFEGDGLLAGGGSCCLALKLQSCLTFSLNFS